MEIQVIESGQRGLTMTPWLNSRHSFSFGTYYDPHRLNFGTLRVLNEDIVQPSKGFGMHEHDNMEIVTIVLKGALEHQDSLGNQGIIEEGHIQRMTAGRGVSHSEYNASKDQVVHFLQIWIFPKTRDLTPSYEQKRLPKEEMHNQLCLICSPAFHEKSLFIHQDTQLYLGNFDEGKEGKHQIFSSQRGVFFFVIEGEVTIGDKKLKKGDAAQIKQTKEVKFNTVSPAEVLLIEVGLQPL